MKPMRISFLLLTFVLVAGSLAAQPKRVFPKPVKKLDFGMSMAEFSDGFREIDPRRLERDGFRYVWKEEFDGEAEVDWVVFYFDDADDRPLYEVIIEYRDLPTRDRWLARSYGPPNAENGTEWRFATKSGYDMRAWCYKNRLVIVAVLPGTEWAE